MAADYASKYEPYLSMLDFNPDCGPMQAERIAEKCFHAQAWLVKDLAVAEYKEMLLNDALDVKKAELLITVPSAFTNAETRKAWVVTQQSCKEAQQAFAQAKSQVEYLKRVLRLMEGSQIYYGQKARR